MTRWPTAMRGRCAPASPCQLGSPCCLARALDERTHDRALIAGSQIRTAPLELPCGQVPDRVQQRGLQAGEREVEPGDPRNGKLVRARVAVAREAVDLRAAGIAEPEEPRPLVEGLARS